jgi:hypothetical protein
MTSFTNVQVNYPRLHSILDVGKVEEGQLEFLFVGVVSKAVVRVRFLIRPQSCRATLHRTRFSSFCKKKKLSGVPAFIGSLFRNFIRKCIEVGVRTTPQVEISS